MPVPIEPGSNTDQLQRRNRELSILNAIAEALNREIDLQQALQTALARTAELLELHTGWIWLLREDDGDSYLAASLNLPPALADAPQRMAGSCYCLDTYNAGDLDGAANVNVLICSRLSGLVDGTDGLRYHASIPLYAHGKDLGVLNVASADWRGLSPDDLRILYTIGDLLGIAVERARLFTRSAQVGAVEERNRLAREIHDTLAQGLAGIALQLETAEALLETSDNPGRARQAVHQALALARANLEEARRSVMGLRAAPLEGRALPEALRAMAAEWSGKSGVKAEVKVSGHDRPLPAPVESALYRITQEALTNVDRHARAQAVTISFTLQPRLVSLMIADDGQGFDPDNATAGRYGLVGLNERARLLGGKLEVVSETGRGTQITVSIPLEQA